MPSQLLIIVSFFCPEKIKHAHLDIIQNHKTLELPLKVAFAFIWSVCPDPWDEGLLDTTSLSSKLGGKVCVHIILPRPRSWDYSGLLLLFKTLKLESWLTTSLCTACLLLNKVTFSTEFNRQHLLNLCLNLFMMTYGVHTEFLLFGKKFFLTVVDDYSILDFFFFWWISSLRHLLF